jgi:hypothetical protein
MMRLLPNETVLIGKWELISGQMQGDQTEERIELLVSGLLEKVSSASGGWEILYRDPRDGRYWELTFPRSEMHGSGPRALRFIEQSEAQNKYTISALGR